MTDAERLANHLEYLEWLDRVRGPIYRRLGIIGPNDKYPTEEWEKINQ